MAESFPQDPTLPLFEDRTVFYNVVQPHGENGEYPHPAWITERLSVEEIGQVGDPRLKEALHRQFVASEKDPDWSHQIFVNPDGTFKHAIKVPTRPLNVRFTSEGIKEVGDDVHVPSVEENDVLTASKFTRTQRVLGWLHR